MKITSIKSYHCRAGWRVWTFIKIETNNEIFGWSECSESNGSPKGIEGVIEDIKVFLIGKNPLEVEKLSLEMYSRTIQSSGGVVQKAISGIENALLDIKGKWHGVPVYELFGGIIRDTIPVYWSHCATTRIRAFEVVQKPQIKSFLDLKKFTSEINQSGFKYIKTNIGFPEDRPPIVYMPGNNKTYGWPELEINKEIENKIEKWISTFHENIDSQISIILDLNYNFKINGYIRVANLLEKYNLAWLEIDTHRSESLLEIKKNIKTPICSGENLLGAKQYKSYFDNYSLDIASIDVLWNGFLQSKKIADLADIYQLNITPHNFNGVLSTFISAHLSAVVPNFKIMEIDMDDVPWREELFTVLPQIENGQMLIPSGIGWGTELNEKILFKYAL